jgi:transposase InsO family protein
MIPEEKKIKSFEYNIPECKKDVRSFIGYVSFFRKFIRGFTQLMIPLYDVIKKGKFVWTENADKSFSKLQQEIRENSGLYLPNFEKQFILYTDASEDTIGGTLMQVVDLQECPIFFISRRLNKAEMNYTVTEKEALAIVWSVKQYKVYLANEFVIKTDHLALKYLLDLKETSGRIMRWNLFLQEFNFKIEYIKGKDNVIADALTRSLRSSGSIAAVNNISDERKNELIRRCHIESGHSGILPTYKLCLEQTHWRNMYKDVKAQIDTCEICKKYSRSKANLQQYRLTLNQPFSRVGIDVVGPLPKSWRGNKYLLVATDHLTRWAEAKAVKTKSVKETAKFIMEIMNRHGPPEELLSDRGKEFLNSTVAKLCELMNTKKTYTAAYNPKCNGAVER